MTSQRTYSEAQRVDAIARANVIGAAAASRELDIPAASIRSWRKRAVAAASKVLGVEVLAGVSWEERCEVLLPALGTFATAALERAEREARDGSARDARDLLVAVGIAADKAQLLAGRATSRSESRSESASLVVHRDETAIAEEIVRLRQELGINGG